MIAAQKYDYFNIIYINAAEATVAANSGLTEMSETGSPAAFRSSKKKSCNL